jgi:hypothetical protein
MYRNIIWLTWEGDGDMKKALIIPNTLKEKSVEFAPRAATFLNEKGYETEIVTSTYNGQRKYELFKYEIRQIKKTLLFEEIIIRLV